MAKSNGENARQKLDEIVGKIETWAQENHDSPHAARLQEWISKRQTGEGAEPMIDIFTWIGCRKELRPLGLSMLETLRGMRLTDIMSIAERRMIFLLVGIVMARLNNTMLKENIMDPEIAFESLAYTAEILQTEIAFSCVPDISAFAESYGCETKIPDDAVALVTKHSVQNLEDLKSLESSGPQWRDRLLNNFKVLELMKERYSLFKLVLAGGPFSMAAILAGTENLARKIIKDPEFVERLLEFCTGISTSAVQMVAAAGADIIYIGDPTSGLLSKKHYERFAAPYVKRVVDAAGCPAVLHVCGKTTHIIEPMCGTGVQGISLDTMVDLPSIVSIVPQDIAIIGNLDPVGPLLTGTPEETVSATKQLMDSMQHVPNYMFSAGCEVAPETPLENIQAMMHAVRAYR